MAINRFNPLLFCFRLEETLDELVNLPSITLESWSYQWSTPGYRMFVETTELPYSIPTDRIGQGYSADAKDGGEVLTTLATCAHP